MTGHKVFLLTVSLIGVLTAGAGCGSGSFGSGSAGTSVTGAMESKAVGDVGSEKFPVTEETDENAQSAETSEASTLQSDVSDERLTEGDSVYRGFRMDNVLHDQTEGDIHFHLYVPESYDGTQSYALFITLPGYQGLYFQGVGENIRTEGFAFEAQKYNNRMIIAAPQLNDWGETSADQTIALTRWLLSAYNIDTSRVYIEGYSGGGETLSRVLDKAPELYTAAMMCSSQWDGGYDRITEARTPVYFAVGEADEYYGPEPFRKAVQGIQEAYQEAGLSDEEINSLVKLDVKPSSYFSQGGVTNQHGGGGALFSHDKEMMSWLFSQVRG